MIKINKTLLDQLSVEAKKSPRLRMNHNFHTSLDDSIHRFLNAMEPGSYLRPHRHKEPDKEEIFLVLRGALQMLIFDDNGNITETFKISPAEQIYGAELEAGVWHSMFVLEPDTVVYEIKRGPYSVLSDKDFATWSPDPSDTIAIKALLELWMKHI